MSLLGISGTDCGAIVKFPISRSIMEIKIGNFGIRLDSASGGGVHDPKNPRRSQSMQLDC